MDVPPDVRRRFTRRISRDGLRLKIELLRGLWLKAPFYGIGVSTSDHEHASFMIDRPYARCGPKDFEALVAKIRTAVCAREGCGRRYLADNPDNPDGLCRAHWRKQLDVDVEREMKEQRARIRRENAAARKRGLRYRADIVIHRNNGSDRWVTHFFKVKPTTGRLDKIAKKWKSAMLGDYRVVRL